MVHWAHSTSEIQPSEPLTFDPVRWIRCLLLLLLMDVETETQRALRFAQGHRTGSGFKWICATHVITSSDSQIFFPLLALAFVIGGVIRKIFENVLHLYMPCTLAVFVFFFEMTWQTHKLFWNSQVFLLTFKRWLFTQVLHFPWEILFNSLPLSLRKELCCWTVPFNFGDTILQSGITHRNVFLWDDGGVVTGLPLFRSSLLVFLLVLGSA